jgi:DNA-binding NarL/FixJ family response regulator
MADAVSSGRRAGGRRIRVVLADDHAILRDGLRKLLEQEPDMDVVGEAGNGREAVQLVRTLTPDVVLLDIAMPELNGVEASRQILSLVPGTKIVVLSMHSDARYIREMLAIGAVGYLLKQSAFDEIVEATRAAARNQAYFSPAVAGVVAEQFRAKDDPSPLTPREKQVLQLLAESNSSRQVAAKLHISVKTVETHRRHLMAKLDIHSLAGLTKYAVRVGLTAIDS